MNSGKQNYIFLSYHQEGKNEYFGYAEWSEWQSLKCEGSLQHASGAVWLIHFRKYALDNLIFYLKPKRYILPDTSKTRVKMKHQKV